MYAWLLTTRIASPPAPERLSARPALDAPARGAYGLAVAGTDRETEPEAAAEPPAPAPAVAPSGSWTGLLRGPVDQHSPERLLQLQRAAGNARVAGLLREVAPPPAPAAAPGGALLTEDEAGDPGTGRMPVGAFLEAVERAVTELAEKEIGAVFKVVGCPWLAHWIGYYRQKPAGEVEAALKRYAPAAAGAKTAQEYVSLVVDRVREGIVTWRLTGATPAPPADGPGSPPGMAAAPTEDGSPTGPAAAPPAAAPAFKMASARTGPDVGTGGLGGRLGVGERIDSATAGAIGGAFGADLSDVRVHRDSSVVGGMGARAMAIGRDVAFAPGQYEPGTVVGDALIAHELAHVVQQATPGAATADTATLERDADSAAMGAIAARWSGGSARAPARAANPLTAQSCIPPSPAKGDELVGPEAEKLANKFGVFLIVEPGYDEDKDVPLGYKPRFWLKAPLTMGRHGTGQTHGVAGYYVRKPGTDSEFRRRNSQGGGRFSIELDEEGFWMVAAKVRIDDKEAYLVREFTVVASDELADEAFGSVKTADYVGYRTMLTQERTKRAKGGELDQSRASGPWITNETPGAANPAAPSMDSMTFKAHPDPKATNKPAKYRWWAIPSQVGDHDDYTHRVDLGARTNYKGEFAFYRGEQAEATFRASSPVRVDMVCELIGADDKLVGTARYRQMVLDKQDRDSVAAVDKLIKEGAANYKKIEPGKARGVKAMHFDSRRNRTSSLNMFIGPKAGDPSRTMLVDLTPGAEFVEHEGKTVEDAIQHLDDNNSYSTGQLLIQFDGPPVVNKRLKTDGDTDLEEAAGKTGIGSAILVALGVVAAATGVGAIAAPYLIAGGLAAGVASGGMSIANELRKAEPSGLKISLDVAGIVGALAGAGGMAQAVRMGSVELAMATAAGRFFIYTGFAFDAAGGLLLAVDTADKVEQIRKNPKMTDEEKIDAIQKLITQAVVVGGLIAWGARDIGAARTRVRSFIGEDRLGTLRSDQLYTLQALDDTLLRALRDVPVKEFEAVAAAVAKDPRKAAALSKAFGKQFLEEVRANPSRSLDETAEVLGGKAVGAPVGGTMGPDTYTLDPKGGIRSKDRFEKGMGAKNLKEGRIHGATLDKVTISEKPDLQAVVELTVKGEKVEITVRPTKTTDLKKGAHGDDAGSGRIVKLEPPVGTGPWTAQVQLDNHLTHDLVSHVLGHELDEIADFIVTKGKAGIGMLKDEMEAGLFVAWSKRRQAGPPSITSHDRAAAREYLSVAADMRDAQIEMGKKGAPKSWEARAKERQATLERLEKSMGLLDPEHIELKLKTLRDSVETLDDRRKNFLLKPDDTTNAVVFDDMMERVRRGVTAADAAIAKALKSGGTETVFSAELVAHMMRAHPTDEGKFIGSGINGGHHDRNLKEFVKLNPEYALVQQNEATSGFVTYRTYRQYRWTDKTRPPTPAGTPGHPAGTGAIDAAWKPAAPLKTTFDEADMFFSDVDRVVKKWMGDLKEAERRAPIASPQSIGTDPKVTMFFDYTPEVAGTPPTPGKFTVKTIFVDETWIKNAEAAAKTPTPAPTGVTK